VVVTVSTLRYRRLVFKNLNPQWDQPVRGEMNVDGIRRHYPNWSSFFRWDWFAGTVVGDDLVALVPATQTGQPLILTKSMFVGLEHWDRVLGVCLAIGILSEDGDPSEDRRRRQNLMILRQNNRSRSVEPPVGAIRFRGNMREGDFDEAPSRFRRRQRPLRTHVINTVLGISLIVLLARVSDFVLDEMLLLPAVAMLYVLAMWIFAPSRYTNPHRRLYFLNGFATESALVCDFQIHVTEVPWSTLRLVKESNQLIMLRLQGVIQLIVLRADMFDSDEHWQRFRRLVPGISDSNADHPR
jgi:hypothetical protein